MQDPTYLAWNYSIRSRDGKVAQHLDAKDIGFQAGNWYVNMHSIGIEHEGFAAQGAQWYTESLYQNSATLVRYLAEQVLGQARPGPHHRARPGAGHPAGQRRRHALGPGPVLGLGALHESARTRRSSPTVPAGSNIVTVKPGFDDNQQTVTGCDSDPTTTDTCPTQGTNFVYLHQQPSASSPLVTDKGLHPDESPSTTNVSDHGARVAAGQKLVVSERQGDWLGVWYLGQYRLAVLARERPERRPVDRSRS